MILPTNAIEEVCELAKQRRGTFIANDYLGEDRVKIVYEMPLADIIVDFTTRSSPSRAVTAPSTTNSKATSRPSSSGSTSSSTRRSATPSLA